MNVSNKFSVQELVKGLATLGLREVIICPGSRNAPLTISFNRHPAFHCTSVRDERSAAFYALGKCIELKQPVAVVCTSGSAALNFAPAIAEAYYLRQPLLVFTADRPAEWVNQGEGQTIHQKNVYVNYIRKSYSLYGDASHPDELWHIRRSVSEGFSIATHIDPGPVHYNISFREPLYDLGPMTGAQARVFQRLRPALQLFPEDLTHMRQTYQEAPRVMLLVGQHLPDKTFEQMLRQMACFPNTVVLCESTGNVQGDRFISHIDRLISTLPAPDVSHFMPDLLITFGGAVVSKRIKSMLRKHKPVQHWNVDEHDSTMDTYQSLTRAIPMGATVFLEQLLNTEDWAQKMKSATTRFDGNYAHRWLDRDNRLRQRHDAFCRQASYSDFLAFSKVFELMPAALHLHLANSSPVRYAQLFGNRQIASTWCNRGTSGIDGSTSTAMGAAAASPHKQFLFITGDVAFYYDINAFWNERVPDNLKIILINNGGGGIFRIIPGPAGTEELEEFFETARIGSAQKFAAAIGWQYLHAQDETGLNNQLPAFFEHKGKCLLEISTPPKENAGVLDQYWQYLQSE